MRGFTMLLVVYTHILDFSYPIDYYAINSYNTLIRLFRMPLFFFVSGFVLYKANQIWDFKNSITFIVKKFKVQIISTMIFMSLFCYIFDISIFNAIFRNGKAGYWFTITLFEYYILYITITTLLKNIKNKVWYDISLLAIGFITYLATFKPEEIYQLIGASPSIF